MSVTEKTKYLGICEKHWPTGYPSIIVKGGSKRPVKPPSIFGTPVSFNIQTAASTSLSRNVEKRGVSSQVRSQISEKSALDKAEEKDKIISWDNLLTFCKSLPLAVQEINESLRLIKIDESLFTAYYSVVITKDFHVSAQKGSQKVTVRHLLHSFSYKLSRYSEIRDILDYLENSSFNITSDLHVHGKRILELNDLNIDESDSMKEKQIRFISNQMILTDTKGVTGRRYTHENITEALNIFLRSRSAYKALREILILPSEKHLKSFFGKLGTPGSLNECKEVIEKVFLEFNDKQKLCFLTADEIYIKPAIRFRGNHIFGMSVNEEEPSPAKTILALMINPILGAPAFMARLFPVNNLKADFLYEQLKMLTNIIHDCGGVVFSAMTDNLSVNQKTFKLFHEEFQSNDISSIEHPITNGLFDEFFLLYDPVHLIKNIRNNWVTEKTKTLQFKDPDTNRVVCAKWSDIVHIYKEEENNIVKSTKLDYRSLYPNNFEKQKVQLVFNIFNEKTVARLEESNLTETAIFVRQVTRLINIINVKSENTGIRLNDDDRKPIYNIDDPRLTFMQNMATSFKEMDSSKRGARVRSLTGETANALHVTLNGLVQLIRKLLLLNIPYVLPGKLQSDRHEGEFGIYRQSGGGNYLISADEVLNSLNLQRLKLFNTLDITPFENEVSDECCKENLKDNEEDIELLESVFNEASNLNETERSTLYYISGYVAHKENMALPVSTVISDSSEFTKLVSRGRLAHPPLSLFDLSLYLYTFFKLRQKKCCAKIFLQAYKEIYTATGYNIANTDSVLRRFSNCFLKAYAKDETNKVKNNQEKKNLKRRKLNPR